jgi:hypothetical protein
MMTNCVFGHLALKFGAHPENLASEALNYIVNKSPNAKHSFVRYLNNLTNLKLQHELTFDTQHHGEDNGIPDLVGINSKKEQVLIVETKFWAGLTEHQPVTYLKRLPPGEQGILLFVAPELRMPALWNELSRRCKEVDIELNDLMTDRADVFLSPLNEYHYLSACTWRSVLEYIKTELSQANEHQTVSDIDQLLGLSNVMDAEAFWPLQSEELTGSIPNRLQQFSQIIDDIGNMAAKRGFSVVNKSSHFGWRGKQVEINSVKFWYYFDTYVWHEFGLSPFWIIFDTNETAVLDVKNKLSVLKTATPPRLYADSHGRYIVPLFVKTGVEKNVVVDTILDQMIEIAGYLN